MYALALALIAVVLAAVAPRIMARLKVFRRSPRAALVAWQAVSLAAVLSALAVAPAAIPFLTRTHTIACASEECPSAVAAWRTQWWAVLVVAAVVTFAVLLPLLVSGHRIGTRLRAARTRHTELVDVLGDPREEDGTQLRVLAHATPTAYCLPGRRSRVVLTEGALTALPTGELSAVLAHERAHLRGRHDLLLEYFTVLHHSVPGPVRSPEALREVRLLIEALADRAASRASGPVETARALLTLAHGQTPVAGLGAGGQGATAARMRLLADRPLPAPVVALMYLYAAAVVALPLTLLWLAWR
ncbi:Zn-dependent protease with chaperone function [Knoellia remsis]|uniref:Zn-dependent protease with chaperone function n=1 Tax=Knoellia remsis TaxID=407159 RepID=A0A2T0UCK1_9MICO|nr:M56 family metallopeptidase [Knoellia remsis]PRY55665.1 Zn-dependent protease with chaperone function [Knoellia remsis]